MEVPQLDERPTTRTRPKVVVVGGGFGGVNVSRGRVVLGQAAPRLLVGALALVYEESSAPHDNARSGHRRDRCSGFCGCRHHFIWKGRAATIGDVV